MTLHRGRPATATRALPEKVIPAGPSLERILNFGKEGTAKTYAWLSIAEAYPDVRFKVIDTDDAVQRMVETDFPELTNIDVAVAQDWEGFTAAARRFMEEAKKITDSAPPERKEDYPWIIVDFSDATWDMVQNYFTEQVFNEGIADYFLQARKGLKSSKAALQPLEGWTDWQVINKLYQEIWNVLTKGGGRYHLYITAGSAQVSGLENKSLYKSLKFMPRGEKRMGHRVHTVLMSSVDKDGWYLSSAKDRGRELLDDKPNPNFAITYLMKVAKWQR